MVSVVAASPIYIDEENRKQLTFDSPDKYNPVFSPDGSKIAYITQIHYDPVTSNSYDWSLWVMNSDGSNQKKIFDNLISRNVANDKLTQYKVHIATDIPPLFSWNKDGDKILISRYIIELNSNYFMYQPCNGCGGRSGSLDEYTGKREEIEHDDNYIASSWLVDNKILFSEGQSLYILDSLDKNPRKLMDATGTLQLIQLKSGNKFARIENTYLRIVDLATLKEISNRQIDNHYYAFYPTPDDSRAILEDGYTNFYLVDFSVNKSYKLVDAPFYGGLSLNPDGTKIAYIKEGQIFYSYVSSVRIDIQSNPSGADVYIDNKSQSIKTPNYFYSNPGNLHKIQIKKSGYEAWESTYKVNSSWGSIINFSVNLTLKDSDNDGWTDKKENEMGTDPNSKDTDNDGLLDPDDPNPTIFDAKETEPLNRNYLIVAGMLGLVIIGIVTRPAIKRYYLKRKLRQTPTDWCPHCHKFSGNSSICPHCGKETLVYVKSNNETKNK